MNLDYPETVRVCCASLSRTEIQDLILGNKAKVYIDVPGVPLRKDSKLLKGGMRQRVLLFVLSLNIDL